MTTYCAAKTYLDPTPVIVVIQGGFRADSQFTCMALTVEGQNYFYSPGTNELLGVDDMPVRIMPDKDVELKQIRLRRHLTKWCDRKAIERAS